jgi:hypothetical protein
MHLPHICTIEHLRPLPSADVPRVRVRSRVSTADRESIAQGWHSGFLEAPSGPLMEGRLLTGARSIDSCGTWPLEGEGEVW